MYRELKDSDKEKESGKMVIHSSHTHTHTHTHFILKCQKGKDEPYNPTSYPFPLCRTSASTASVSAVVPAV